MHGVLEVELRGQRRKVVGVVIHVVAGADLTRAAMAASVMGDHAEAMLQEEQHLRIPIVSRKRPAMAEHDRPTRTPVLVENLGTVLGGDRRHVLVPFRRSEAERI
jgi:hypothetical protein